MAKVIGHFYKHRLLGAVRNYWENSTDIKTKNGCSLTVCTVSPANFTKLKHDHVEHLNISCKNFCTIEQKTVLLANSIDRLTVGNLYRPN